LVKNRNSLVNSGRDVRGFFGGYLFLSESRKNIFSLVDEFPELTLVGLGKTQRISIVEGVRSSPPTNLFL